MSSSSLSLKLRQQVPVFELPARLGATVFTNYLATLDRSLGQLTPFAMIIDGRALEGGIEEAPRGSWSRVRTTRIIAFHRGVAFVTGANMSSERVRVLCSMQPPRVPYAFFGDREEAMHWVAQRIEGVSPERSNRRKTVSLATLS